jgi:two-component system, sensor histidine kinase RpfC
MGIGGVCEHSTELLSRLGAEAAGMRGWLNIIRNRLAARADSEHEMSLNRLAFLILMTIYVLIDPVMQETGALIVMGVGLIAVVGIFAHLLCFPAPNTSRRVFAACCDLFTISFQIHAGGAAGAAFYPLLLWTVLGNGFRFGSRWLAISGGIAFVCFAAVVVTTPFWRQQVPLCVGLGAALLIIPGYTATLIRKLDSARRQAEIANAAKTMFLAAVSHELRTPLHAIMGAQAALQATPLDETQREMSGIARQGAQILLASIEELLDFSQIEAGHVRLNPVEFALLELLAEVISLFRATAAEKSLRLSLHVEAGCALFLRGERRYLKDILQNLIGNAMKFTRQGGVLIAVRSEATDAPGADGHSCLLVIEVIDTGIGIAAESLEHVFDSFRQADDTILDEFGGTGLGLSICRRLALAMSATVEVDSTQGKGSTFRFRGTFEWLAEPDERAPLPPFRLADETGTVAVRLAAVAAGELERVDPDSSLVVTTAHDAAAHTHPNVTRDTVILVADTYIPDGVDARWHCLTHLSARFTRMDWMVAMKLARSALDGQVKFGGEVIPFRPARRPLHVLVADDNVLNQRVITRILEQAGHRVTIASDGEAALELIDVRAPDVVLMDVNMSRMNGIEATRLYRASSLDLPHLPIVGLTADATPATQRTCLSAGMDACLIKPVELETLMATLDRLTATAAADAARPAAPSPSARVVPLATSAQVVALATPARVVALATYRSGAEPDQSGDEEEKPQPSLLDSAKLERLFELGGADFMHQMIALFATQAEAAKGDLRDAHRQDDLFRFREVAHSLLSGAVNIGADRVAIEAERLQSVPVKTFTLNEAIVLTPLLTEISTVQAEIARRRLS